MLNACPYALSRRRYNDHHDAILACIRDFLAGQLSPSQSITVDLPNQPYSFPQQVACTDSRPDIVVWDRSAITIIELTVPFELCVDSAVARKTKRYSELLGTYRDAGYKANLLTLEVGSRGFIHTDSFNKLPVFSCHQSQTGCPGEGGGAHVSATVLPGLAQVQLERACHQPCCCMLTKPHCYLFQAFLHCQSLCPCYPYPYPFPCSFHYLFNLATYCFK